MELTNGTAIRQTKKTLGQLRKQGHLYETQIHLVNSATSITCVEHCEFLNPEKKKIAKEQKERITLEKIQFQCLQYHHTI